MKWISPENIKQVADCTNGTVATLAASVQSTFEEVYENLEAIDEQVGGFCYSSEEEMITLPSRIENKEEV